MPGNSCSCFAFTIAFSYEKNNMLLSIIETLENTPHSPYASGGKTRDRSGVKTIDNPITTTLLTESLKMLRKKGVSKIVFM